MSSSFLSGRGGAAKGHVFSEALAFDVALLLDLSVSHITITIEYL